VDESYKALIAAALGLSCVGIFVFEVVKKTEMQITTEKLVALGVGGLYLLLACLAEATALPIVLVMLLVPLGLIWFGDELGSMTGMSMRGGTVNKASPGFLVRLCGWFFLLMPIGLAVYWGIA
jgi:hypothetical protein